MIDYRYLIVGGGMTGDAACKGIRRSTRTARSGWSGTSQTPRTRVRRSRRACGLARRRARSGAGQRTWASTCTSAARSFRSTSMRAPPPTTEARRTLRAAAGRHRRAPARDARSARRGLVLPHARRLPRAPRGRERGDAHRRGGRRVHRLRDRRGAGGERMRGDDALPRARPSARVSSRATSRSS